MMSSASKPGISIEINDNALTASLTIGNWGTNSSGGLGLLDL